MSSRAAKLSATSRPGAASTQRKVPRPPPTIDGLPASPPLHAPTAAARTESRTNATQHGPKASAAGRVPASANTAVAAAAYGATKTAVAAAAASRESARAKAAVAAAASGAAARQTARAKTAVAAVANGATTAAVAAAANGATTAAVAAAANGATTAAVAAAASGAAARHTARAKTAVAAAASGAAGRGPARAKAAVAAIVGSTQPAVATRRPQPAAEAAKNAKSIRDKVRHLWGLMTNDTHMLPDKELEQYLTRQTLDEKRAFERQQAYRAAVAPAATKQICCMCGFMKFFEDERMHRCTLGDVLRRLRPIADDDSLTTRAKVSGTLYPLDPAGLPSNVEDHSLSTEVYLCSTTDKPSNYKGVGCDTIVTITNDDAKLPAYSIAAGTDWTDPTGCPVVANLTQRRFIEKVIALERPYQELLKCRFSVAPEMGSSSFVKEQSILFAHEGPDVVVRAVPTLLAETFRVALIGSRRGRGQTMEQRLDVPVAALKETMSFHKRFNPIYEHISVRDTPFEAAYWKDQIEAILNDAIDEDSDEAVAVDEAIEADVANVRDLSNGTSTSVLVVDPGSRFDEQRLFSELDKAANQQSAASADGTGSASTASRQKPRREDDREPIEREKNPSDGFDFQAKAVGAFPVLFPRGRITGDATLAKVTNVELFRRMLQHHTGKFAAHAAFICFAGDMKIRQRHLTDVADYVHVRENYAEEFVDLMNSDEFKSQIATANAEFTPDEASTDDAKAAAKREFLETRSKARQYVFRKVWPTLQATGRRSPFSAMELRSLHAYLYSLALMLGYPQYFETVAPDDARSHIMRTIVGNLTTTPGEDVLGNLPVADVYAGIGARVYRRVMDNISAHLVGCPLELNTSDVDRVTGIYGDIVAWAGSVEMQQKLALHSHMLRFGGLTPHIIARVAGSEDLSALARHAMDTHLLATHPDGDRDAPDDRPDLTRPCPDVGTPEFSARRDEMYRTKLHHLHRGNRGQAVCEKGKRGKTMCTSSCRRAATARRWPSAPRRAASGPSRCSRWGRTRTRASRPAGATWRSPRPGTRRIMCRAR